MKQLFIMWYDPLSKPIQGYWILDGTYTEILLQVYELADPRCIKMELSGGFWAIYADRDCEPFTWK